MGNCFGTDNLNDEPEVGETYYCAECRKNKAVYKFNYYVICQCDTCDWNRKQKNYPYNGESCQHICKECETGLFINLYFGLKEPINTKTFVRKIILSYHNEQWRKERFMYRNEIIKRELLNKVKTIY